MDKNVAIFLFGCLILGLLGWYLFTDSEWRKRILGTILTILVTGFCIWASYPPFDVKDANGQVAPTVDAVRAFLVEGESGKPSERKLPADMKLTTLDTDKAVVFESRKAGAAAPVRRSYVSK